MHIYKYIAVTIVPIEQTVQEQSTLMRPDGAYWRTQLDSCTAQVRDMCYSTSDIKSTN